MDKKIRIEFGRPPVQREIVKVPVRPMTRAEAFTKCVGSVCGVATYGIMVWGIITLLCGNPFRKKTVVIKTDEKKDDKDN